MTPATIACLCVSLACLVGVAVAEKVSAATGGGFPPQGFLPQRRIAVVTYPRDYSAEELETLRGAIEAAEVRMYLMFADDMKSVQVRYVSRKQAAAIVERTLKPVHFNCRNESS